MTLPDMMKALADLARFDNLPFLPSWPPFGRACLALGLALAYFAWMHRAWIAEWWAKSHPKKPEEADAPTKKASGEPWIPSTSYRRKFAGEFLSLALWAAMSFVLFAVLTGHFWTGLFVIWVASLLAIRVIVMLLDAALFGDEAIRNKLDYISPFYEFTDRALHPALEWLRNSWGLINYIIYWGSIAVAIAVTLFGLKLTVLPADVLVALLLFALPAAVYTGVHAVMIFEQMSHDYIDNDVRFYQSSRVLYFVPVFLLLLCLPISHYFKITLSLAQSAVVAAIPFVLILLPSLIGAYRHLVRSNNLMRTRLDVADGLMASLEIPPELRGVREMSKQRLVTELRQSAERGVYRYYLLYVLLYYYGLDVANGLLQMGFLLSRLADKVEFEDTPDNHKRYDAVIELLNRFHLFHQELTADSFLKFLVPLMSLWSKGAYLEQWDIYCAHINDLLTMYMAFRGNDPYRAVEIDKQTGKPREPSDEHTRKAIAALSDKIKRHKTEHEGLIGPAALVGVLTLIWGAISFVLDHYTK